VLKIIIADDELPIREWLKYCLNGREDRFEIVGMAADGIRAYDLVMEKRPDVLITDIRMPHMNGTTLMERLRESSPDIEFVVLTNHADFSYARRAISCGVREYILKSELRSSELIEILENIDNEHHRPHKDVSAGIMKLAASPAPGEDADSLARSHEAVEEALAYIRKHFHENLSLEDVSGHVYRSPAYFSRLFKEITGENFSIYLIHYRLEKAKSLLLETEMKITDISCRVGYQNPSYFSRLYKKHMGRTPEEERRQGKKSK